MVSKKLTTQEYWENYYNKNYGNKEHIVSVCSYYDNFWNKLLNTSDSGNSIIEIGGFPGRYLAYLSSKYNLVPTCLDFNSDSTQIEATFNVMGVTDYHILQKDFIKFMPNETYDFVISNGFIEHFENFEEILDLHLRYLKTDGKLFVMIPNKRYLRKIYGHLCDYNNLKAHNLKSMKLKVFREFAKRNNLKINTLQYYGGFPYSVHQELNIFQNFIYRVTRKICQVINPILMKHPSKYFSASIIAIFESK